MMGIRFGSDEMPIYDFECNQCGLRFEEFVWSDKDLKEIRCPSCNSNDIKREVTSPSSNIGSSYVRRKCTPFS